MQSFPLLGSLNHVMFFFHTLLPHGTDYSLQFRQLFILPEITPYAAQELLP